MKNEFLDQLPPSLSTRSSDTRFHDNDGAILVFFSIILVVLIGFIALAMDVGMGESTRGEEAIAVQNAALGAMSSYLEVLKTPTPSQQPFTDAKNVALARADGLLAASGRIAKNYRVQPNATIDLADSGQGEVTFGRMVWAIATPAPNVTPLPSSDESACSQGGTVKLPCFRPIDASSEAASAIQITTRSRDNPLKTIFGKVLGANTYEIGASAVASLIPQNYLFLLDLSSSMLDGASMKDASPYRRFGEQNKKCDPTGFQYCTDANWYYYPACFKAASASYFVYDVDMKAAGEMGCDLALTRGDCACFSSPTNNENCLAFARFPTSQEEETLTVGTVDSARRTARRVFSGYSDWWGGTNASAYVDSFPDGCKPFSNNNSQCPKAGSPALQCSNWNSNLSSPRTNYRLIPPETAKLGKDLVTGVSAEEVGRLIDFRQSTDDTSFNSHPEPLRSVLDATNDAMNFIKQRAVSADRFFLSGFDETIYAARTTCEDESTINCPVGQTLVAPNSPAFTGFLHLTNVKSGVAGNWSTYSEGDGYHFINRTFFPRTGYNTDIQFALWKAYDELTSNPANSASKNLVFLVTDGLANCRYDNPTQPSAAQGTYIFETLEDYAAHRVCDSGASTMGKSVIKAIKQMNSDLKRRMIPGDDSSAKSLVDVFKERGIAVSVILIGKNAAPHILVRPSTAPGGTQGHGTGGCLTNSEAVYGDIPFVDWQHSSTTDSHGYSSYLCPNDAGKPGCSLDGYATELLTKDVIRAVVDPEGNGAGALPISNLLYDELVAPTRGAWIPIMDTLPNPNPPDPNNPDQQGLDFSADLAAQCNAAYDPNPALQGENRSPRIINLTLGGTKVTDQYGRLLYDPKGRSQKQQIIDQVKQVLGGGYILVEPAMRAAN